MSEGDPQKPETQFVRQDIYLALLLLIVVMASSG